MTSYIEPRTSLSASKIETEAASGGAIAPYFDLSARSDWWRGVAAGNDDFYCEYSQDVEGLPNSIAQLPFVLNVLPAVFLTDSVLVLDEIDARLLSSVNHIRDRFAAMYPELEWKGRIEAAKVVNNHIGYTRNTPVSLFSGGVDAVFTALANLAVEPALMTVWGADMFFNSSAGWNTASKANKAFADRFGLEYITAKSSFRTSISYAYVDAEFGKPVKDNWWHGFQHGAALIGIAGPVAYHRGTDKILLASDYAKTDPYVTRSGSETTVVQEINFGGVSSQVHDYNISRHGKVKFICNFAKLHNVDIPLRVCWQSSSGVNCGVCDKCMRTQFAIMAHGHDPERFGFALSVDQRAAITHAISTGAVKVQKAAFWKDIIADLRESKWKDDPLAKSVLEVFAPA